MPAVASARQGARLQIKGKPLAFGFWPMQRTTRRYGVQTAVYAASPFALIRDSVNKQCSGNARSEAAAYISQSEYFLRASQNSPEWAAKPLLLYYSFMNLAKAFALTRATKATFDQAKHGLSEKLTPGGKELIDAYLEVFPSSTSVTNVFAEFYCALTQAPLASNLKLELTALLPQVVAGHRLWTNASGEDERFFSMHDIVFMQDDGAKELWIVIQMLSGDLIRGGISHGLLLARAGLDGTFREVDSADGQSEPILQFEQISPTTYSGRPSDEMPYMVSTLRPAIWATVTSIPPHRHYYLYAAPAAEKDSVLPQCLSIYAIAYYLGSITRYRPQHFDSLLNSPFGGFIQEFLVTQPTQFLYLMASEFAKRDVTKASIV